MRSLKIIILSLACSGFMACATASLPDTATDAEKRAALCLDAKTAYTMAERALAMTPDLSAEAQLYWTLFAAGARTGIESYCGATP